MLKIAKDGSGRYDSVCVYAWSATAQDVWVGVVYSVACAGDSAELSSTLDAQTDWVAVQTVFASLYLHICRCNCPEDSLDFHMSSASWTESRRFCSCSCSGVVDLRARAVVDALLARSRFCNLLIKSCSPLVLVSSDEAPVGDSL